MTSIVNFISLDVFKTQPELGDVVIGNSIFQYLVAKKEDGSFTFDELFSDHYSDFIDLYRCFFGLSSGYEPEDLNVNSIRLQLTKPILFRWIAELTRKGDFTQEQRYQKFVEYVDAGDFSFFEVCDTNKCNKCGKYLSFSMEKWKLVDETATFEKDTSCIKVGEMTVNVNVPTGELVVITGQSDKIQEAVAKYMNEKLGRGMSLGSISGMKNHMQKFGQHNILCVHTSNYSGYFYEYSNVDGSYAIIQASEEFSELEENKAVNAMWADASGGFISIIDKQYLLEILEEMKVDVAKHPINSSHMQIAPGNYNFKTNPKNLLKSRNVKNALKSLGKDFEDLNVYAELVKA